MIQASNRWVYDRRGGYRTVTLVTEVVSSEIGEILLLSKDHALFSLLLGHDDIATLRQSLTALARDMRKLT